MISFNTRLIKVKCMLRITLTAVAMLLHIASCADPALTEGQIIGTYSVIYPEATAQLLKAETGTWEFDADGFVTIHNYNNNALVEEMVTAFSLIDGGMYIYDGNIEITSNQRLGYVEITHYGFRLTEGENDWSFTKISHKDP